MTKNEKISKALKGRTRGSNLMCKSCGKIYYRKPSKIKGSNSCSNSCSTTYKNNNGMGRLGGLSSASKQKRRSKNEIYLSELCEQTFKTIRTNEKMFNGWDADIVIEDYKVAILWNGPWHYKKITKKHSLEQVQQRDKIKIEQIKKCGYIPYIVKDDGKFNNEFVKQEFEKIKIYCGM